MPPPPEPRAETPSTTTLPAMVRFIVIDAAGEVRALEGRAGQSLMRAATGAGVEGIVAECGGTLTCATCHVFVDAAWVDRLAPPEADERAMLEMTAVPAEARSRLSCQVRLGDELDGLVVHLPSHQY